MKNRIINYVLFILIATFAILLPQDVRADEKILLECHYMSQNNQFKASYIEREKNYWLFKRRYGVILVYQIHDGQMLNKEYSTTDSEVEMAFGECPKHVYYRRIKNIFNSDYFYTNADFSGLTGVKDPDAFIKNEENNCRNNSDCHEFGYGTRVSEDQLFKDYVDDGLLKYDTQKKSYTCADVQGWLGGEVKDELNKILLYVRIIVPILIIGLGSLDLAKAVIAGNADNMKKAQKDFMTRIVAGVVVFLVPILVNILFSFADIVWKDESWYDSKENSICDFLN